MEFIKENALLEDTNEVEKQEMDKLQLLIAESIKTLRLSKNMSRENLCIKAGVSMNALRHLEDASSATIRTLVRVVKALNCQGWLFNLAPIISINPLDKIRGGKPRRRGRL